MGNFYVNYTLRGPSQEAVARALAGRSAIVTPADEGCVVVFDEESDEQNDEVIAELASRLSGQFRCPVLAVMNHDDIILWFQLYLSGELVDEYNSAPAYFDAEDEDAAMEGPQGGDAKKLCAAFGPKAVKRVEKILQQGNAADGGYVFEFERHQDLVSALGTSSFSVGTGFETIANGELPDELNERDLIATKEMPPGPPLEDIWRRPVPGYYKISFRANPKLRKSIPSLWMPGTWAELECAETELSEAFQKAAAPYREQFKQLGFIEQGFKKLKRVLNPNHRDSGGIHYLDAGRRQYGQLIYNRSFARVKREEREKMFASFTAVFPDEIVSCTNNFPAYDQDIPNHTVIRIDSNDATVLYEKFLEQLRQRKYQPRRFDDLPALKAWCDAHQNERFEHNVRRGRFVRMSDYEVEKFRRSPE